MGLLKQCWCLLSCPRATLSCAPRLTGNPCMHPPRCRQSHSPAACLCLPPLQLKKLGSKHPVPLILANYDGVYDGKLLLLLCTLCTLRVPSAQRPAQVHAESMRLCCTGNSPAAGSPPHAACSPPAPPSAALP